MSTFTVYGKLVENFSQRPIEGLEVIAKDLDRNEDEFLGSGFSDVNGHFVIRFQLETNRSYYQEFKPDIYFEVFDGEYLICDTKHDLIKKPQSTDNNSINSYSSRRENPC